MRISTVVAVGVLCATVAVTASCEHFFEPCPTIPANQLVAGRWTLSTVNGQVIPTNGVAIPNSTDRLLAGVLEFQNSDNGCESQKLVEEKGITIGTYTLLTSAGAPKPDDSRVADYTHDAKDQVVQLSADLHTADGTVNLSSNATLTFAGSLPPFGTLTLVFRRTN
jgi:hypothetical protein